MNNVLPHAILSRVLMVTMSLIFGFLFTNYDTSTDLFLKQIPTIHHSNLTHKSTEINPVVSLLGSLANWDGIHFLEIANNGYVYDLFLAYFPLYPYFVRFVSNGISLLFGLSQNTSILISGILVSNVSFVFAAVYLYRLSLLILRNEDMAYIATLLFCYNPASIFMSSVYTESFYAFVHFGALYYLEKENLILSTLFFTFASSIRSNGITSIGFIGFRLLQILLRLNIKNKSEAKWKVIKELSLSVLMSIALVLPLIYVGVHGYNLYCYLDNVPEWCLDPIPNVYGYVQTKYWNVCLFCYYKLQQVPNFLLASPITFISFYGIWKYFSFDWKRFISLGYIPSKQISSSSYYHSECLVYIYHWLATTLVAVLLINIQVITRFTASQCPAFFWFLASVMQSKTEQTWKKKAIFWYFSIYWVFGSLMFSNYYPWT